MAKRRKKIRKNKKAYKILSILAVIIAIAVIYFTGGFDSILDKGQREPTVVSGELNVHFIDVGQADCVLVLSEDKVMLVDTGDLDDNYTDKIIDYIQDMGITKIDYLILTHPDADHIGGAPEIIESFDIGKCYLTDFVKTTKIYNDTIDALEEKSVDTAIPEPGESFMLGEASCKILAPLKEYEDANEASIVVRVDFGKRSVMLSGDAEKESEADMAKTYSASELKCDVFKAGHHGSSTSSSDAFLSKVSPDYVIISCGDGNSYGHPHSEVLKRYEKYGIEYYRTDIHGTVVLKTDGEIITITTEKTN